jgi:hypothetical protein
MKSFQVSELFFEPHLPNELEMENAYKNYNPEESVDFIIDVSKLNKAQLIGKNKDGRKLYRLH